MIVRKTKALIESPPLIPRSVKKIENREATDAETIPFGATQDRNNLCRQVNPLFMVHMPILIGRTTNMSTNTVNKLPQPKAKTLAIDKSAASKINNTETPRMVS